MIEEKSVKEFFEWAIKDDEDPLYDEGKPFGGIFEDAPQNAKEAYERYCKELKNAEKEGIRL